MVFKFVLTLSTLQLKRVLFGVYLLVCLFCIELPWSILMLWCFSTKNSLKFVIFQREVLKNSSLFKKKFFEVFWLFKEIFLEVLSFFKGKFLDVPWCFKQKFFEVLWLFIKKFLDFQIGDSLKFLVSCSHLRCILSMTSKLVYSKGFYKSRILQCYVFLFTFLISLLMFIIYLA